MKFGKHLLANMPPEWRFNFIDYSGLKRFLKSNVTATAWDDNLEAKFITMLEEELKKVSDFGFVKYNELARHVQFIENEINKLQDASASPKLAQLKQELDDITGDITKLAKFNSLNYTAFVKILKKHDKVTDYRLKHTFLARLTTQPFYKETFDGMIVTLSALYEKLKPADRADKKGTVNLQSFVRKTTKYWVHADNITAVKCIIMQNLPVLLFKRDPNFSRGYDAAISSIYYDNPQLDLYHERIEKVERALALRLRWYGTRPKEVFVERKTHHEDWTGDKSVKERFSLKEKHVNSYLAGEFTLDQKADKLRARGKKESDIQYQLNLASEIQGQIKKYGLQPCVRTFYNRTAFQHPTSQAVRISLDTELTMIREMERCNGNWFRSEVGVDWPFDYLPANEITRFPYAILEVKLSTAAGEKPPQWIMDLIDSHLVEVVPKFSKFIHGCATLLEERVRLLPFWLPQMEKDIRKPAKPGFPLADIVPTTVPAITQGQGYSAIHMNGIELEDDNEPMEHEEATESTSLLGKKPRRDGRSNASSPTSFRSRGSHARPQPPSRQTKPIALPVRVEPKVFFANERTFLNWLHTAVLISTIGLALLNLAPESKGAKASRIAGLTLIPVAIMFLVYALYTYFWRDRKIKTRDPEPYNTIVGPIAITCVFLGAMVINYIAWFLENGADVSKWD